MRTSLKIYRLFLVVGGVAVLLAATASSSSAEITLKASAPGCAQFQVLKRVFPKATAVGLTSRTAVRREAPRDPVFPGYCATWFAEYSGHDVAAVIYELANADTSLTVYRTHTQALRAFEQTSGPVKRLANGALVHTSNKPHGNGQRRAVNVVSVYRNVVINSLSIAVTPILTAQQLRLHRRIDAGVRAATGRG